MIEVDGELFEDQFETERIKKACAVSRCIIEGVVQSSELYRKGSGIIAPVALEIAKFRANAILNEPLFPHRFKAGGITVNPNLTHEECIIPANFFEYISFNGGKDE